MGCKRVLISNDYLPGARPRRTSRSSPTPSARCASARIVSADGSEREVDTIIFGTGFHVTDMPAAERVRGRDGRTLAEMWDGSPQAHMGAMVAGFPNLFFLVGPNTGLGHNSIVFMIESQMQLRARRAAPDAARAARRELDVRPEAQAAYNARIQERMRGTVWTVGRLRELVPRRARAQHDAVADLHVAVPRAHAQARSCALRAARATAGARARGRLTVAPTAGREVGHA